MFFRVLLWSILQPVVNLFRSQFSYLYNEANDTQLFSQGGMVKYISWHWTDPAYISKDFQNKMFYMHNNLFHLLLF